MSGNRGLALRRRGGPGSVMRVGHGKVTFLSFILILCSLAALLVTGTFMVSHAAPSYNRENIYSSSDIDGFLTDENGKMAFWTSQDKSTADIAISYKRDIQDIYYLASLCGGHSLTSNKLSSEVTAAATVGKVTLDLEGQMYTGALSNDNFMVNLSYSDDPVMRFKVNQKGSTTVNKNASFNLSTANILNEVTSLPNEVKNKYITMRSDTEKVVPLVGPGGSDPSIVMIDNGMHANVIEYAKDIISRIGGTGKKPDVIVLSYDPYAWSLATAELEGTTTADAQIMRQAAELLAPYYENNKVIWLVSDNCVSTSGHRLKTPSELGSSATEPRTTSAYTGCSSGTSGWESWRDGAISFESLYAYLYPKNYNDFISDSKRTTFLDQNNSASDSFYKLAGENYDPAKRFTSAYYPGLWTKMNEANDALAALGVPAVHRFTGLAEYLQYMNAKYAYAHGEQGLYLELNSVVAFLHITRAKYNEISALPLNQQPTALDAWAYAQSNNQATQEKVKLSKKHTFYQWAILDPVHYLEYTGTNGMPSSSNFPSMNVWNVNTPTYAYGDAEGAGNAIKAAFSQYDSYVITDTLASGLTYDSAEVAYYNDSTHQWVTTTSGVNVSCSGQNVTATITNSNLIGKRIRLLIHTKSPSFFHTGSDSSRQPKDTNTNKAKVLTKYQGADSLSETFDSPKLRKNPIITLTKTASPSTINAPTTDSTVTWNFSVKNEGDIPLTNVQITDALLSEQGHQATITFSGGGSTLASLASGATATATATMPITSADIAAGKVDNTATVTGTFGTATDAKVTDSDDATVNLTRSAGLEIEKKVDGVKQKTVNVGDTVTYSIRVHNTGNVALAPVTITDAKLGITNHTIATSLEPGAWSTAYTKEYTTTVTDLATNNGVIVNTASAHGTPPSGVTAPQDPTDTATVTVSGSAALEIEKKVDGEKQKTASIGDTVTYSIRVHNTGNVTLAPVTITDAKLGISNHTVASSLAPGAWSTAYTKTYTVTEADLATNNGVIVNTASAHGTPPTGVTAPQDPTDTATVTVSGNAALEVEKKVDGEKQKAAQIGDTVTYSIRVHNTGDVTLAPVTITDAKLGVTNHTIATSLAPGAWSSEFTKTYTVKESDLTTNSGRIVNTASAHGTPPTGVTAPQDPTDTATVTVSGTPGLSIEKSVSPTSVTGASAVPGHQVTWSFVIRNTGNVTVSNLAVVDQMLTARNISVAIAGNKTSLAPGESVNASAQMPLTQADIDAGKVDNTARATGKDPTNANVTSNDDTATVTIARNAALTVAKAPANGATSVTIGENAVFKVTVTNTGNVTLTHVTINDELTGNANTEVSASLAPGASVDTLVTYGPVTVNDAIAKKVDNLVTAHGTPPAGVNQPADPQATASIPVIATRSIQVEKSVDPTHIADPKPGDTVKWTVVIRNTGQLPLEGITLHDELLEGRGITPTLSSTSLAPGASMTVPDIAMPITEDDITAGFVTNTVLARATDPLDPSGKIESNLATAQVTLNRIAQLAIEKVASKKTLTIGETFSYDIKVTNTGNVPLTNVTITDEKLGIQADEVTAKLAPNQSISKTYLAAAVTQDDAIAGSIHNVAFADGTPPTGMQPIERPSDDETVEVVSDPELTILKTTPKETIDQAKVGTMVTWDFEVKNTGNSTVKDIKVQDDMLTGRKIEVTVDKAELEPGDSAKGTAQMPLTQDDIDAGSVPNVAIAHGTDLVSDEAVDSEPSEAIVKIARKADFTIVKTVDKASAKRGESVNWHVRITNTGNVTLTSITIDDQLLGITGEVIAQKLLPGMSVEKALPYKISDTDANRGTVKNTAIASVKVPAGMEELAKKQAEATVTVPRDDGVNNDIVKTGDMGRMVVAGTFLASSLAGITFILRRRMVLPRG